MDLQQVMTPRGAMAIILLCIFVPITISGILLVSSLTQNPLAAHEPSRAPRSSESPGPSLTGRLCVYQYDSRGVPLLTGAETACTSHARCKYMGRFGLSEISPYWHKVADSLEILEQQPECGGVLCMDSDATVNATMDPILELIETSPTRDFIGTYEQPQYAEGATKSAFNAGVWFVRNSEAGKALLREWLAIYENEGGAAAWAKNEDGEWSCPACDECGWANAPCFEQGSFMRLLEKGTKTSANIMLVEASVLNSKCETQEETCSALICHFAGLDKEGQIENWRNRKAACI